MSRVGIIGIGHGVFGRRSDATVQELAFEAFRLAVRDAGVDREEIDASVIGAVPEYHKQRSVAGVVQEYLGLDPKPTWLTEVACASGSAAIRTAWMAIQSGVHQVVAVIGCQKMTELSTAEILALMGRVGEVQWESVFGTTFPSYYAMFANRHMHEFGTTREQLLAVADGRGKRGHHRCRLIFQQPDRQIDRFARDLRLVALHVDHHVDVAHSPGHLGHPVRAAGGRGVGHHDLAAERSNLVENLAMIGGHANARRPPGSLGGLVGVLDE